MPDDHDTPLPDPTPHATGGVIHPPEAIQDAVARIRHFLTRWGPGDFIAGWGEEFRLNVDDLIVVLDALDAYTVPAGFIEIPEPLTEQQYEDLKAKWRETHQPGQRRVVAVNWHEPTVDELQAFAAQFSETLRTPVSIRYHGNKPEPAAE